jgi:hypothetical protein
MVFDDYCWSCWGRRLTISCYRVPTIGLHIGGTSAKKETFHCTQQKGQPKLQMTIITINWSQTYISDVNIKIIYIIATRKASSLILQEHWRSRQPYLAGEGPDKIWELSATYRSTPISKGTPVTSDSSPSLNTWILEQPVWELQLVSMWTFLFWWHFFKLKDTPPK